MKIIEVLKQALQLTPEEYADMPDYSAMLEHLGMTEDDDPLDIQAAIEDAVEAEAETDSDNAEAEGGDTDAQ